MTRSVNLACVAALALAVGTIEASSFEHTVELTAEVPASCTIGATQRDGRLFETGPNSSSYAITPPTDGLIAAEAFSIEFTNVNCNTGAVEVDLRSDNYGLAKAGGSTKIHYTAQAKLGGDGTPFVTFNTVDNSPATGSADLSETTLAVIVSIPANNDPLPSGTYSDNLRITIHPDS